MIMCGVKHPEVYSLVQVTHVAVPITSCPHLEEPKEGDIALVHPLGAEKESLAVILKLEGGLGPHAYATCRLCAPACNPKEDVEEQECFAELRSVMRTLADCTHTCERSNARALLSLKGSKGMYRLGHPYALLSSIA